MKTPEKSVAELSATAQAQTPAHTAQNRPADTRPDFTTKPAAQAPSPKEQSPVTALPAAKATPNENHAPKLVAVHPDVKPEQGTVNVEAQEKTAPDALKAEATDKSAPEAKPFRSALNLEQTLKSVNGLHRLSMQRLVLLSRIKLLEDFEVKLQEENDELESNPYQGCKLIIRDDKNREFTTSTPNLIRMVSQFIFDACQEKLSDIEANIIFPNA